MYIYKCIFYSYFTIQKIFVNFVNSPFYNVRTGRQCGPRIIITIIRVDRKVAGKMHYSRVAALFMLMFAVTINGSQYIQSRIIASGKLHPYYAKHLMVIIMNWIILSIGGCDSYTCGANARCTMSEGRPVCSCFNLHMGDPLARCVRVECLSE